MSHQPLGLFDFEAPAREPDVPLIYLAMPLSHLSEDEREHIELLASTISRAIEDASKKSSSEPWHIAVHSPVKLSAPWKEDWRTPANVYQLNSKVLWEQADALIVIGHNGGSLGGGQEFAWAASLHLPILYVHRSGVTVSRQLQGAASEHDLQISPYNTPDDLADIVSRWLCSRRHMVSDGPRRRRNRMLLWTEHQTRLHHAWNRLSETGRAHVVATTRIAHGRIERLLGSAGALSQASASEVSELSAALQLKITDMTVGPSLPDLRVEQQRALLNASSEFGWTMEETFKLYDAARLELARGGVRRLPFASPYDWRVFRERQRHEL